MGPMAIRAQIIVKGVVQGVGFRPFVYNLADSLDIKGYVTNTSEGVFIDAEGRRLPEFVRMLKDKAPPLSHITDVIVTHLPLHGYSGFSIQKSVDAAGTLPFTLISPDVSICENCLHEMLDPGDRRYLYPFINCTNCGPRFSITMSVPYDRPNTTMAGFPMCSGCLKEYHDPRSRRFHAQPNACTVCGPQVEFTAQHSTFDMDSHDNPVQNTIRLLKQGGIAAVKGLGGFHLACDAANDDAVKRLRERKRKSNKPFAIMVPSVESAHRFCVISDEEERLLLSIRRPIVLLKKKSTMPLSGSVSPHNQFVGIMLPYTPLHYLLFHHPLKPGVEEATPHFHALVMTSGNLSEEPIVHTNKEAIQKLSGLVDGFLFHDRDIFMREDDSVVRIAHTTEQRSAALPAMPSSHAESHHTGTEMSFIRRSRGYAPEPIALRDGGPEVLGCGADLKTTFTLTKGEFAIPSQHIGDMENYETLMFYEESLANLKAVYRAEPSALVHDLHPGYVTARWALEQGERTGLRTYGIQHHYAHIGSVMAEYGITEPVIGVSMDGTGYGTDGNLWGSEFLVADIDGFKRTAQFHYIALPGGEAAIRAPWKTAVSYITQAAPDEVLGNLEKLAFLEKFGRETIERLLLIVQSRELSPLASGAGRLFDAVSAILGICDENTYEGEAAIALESFTREGIEGEYDVAFKVKNSYSVIDFSPAIREIIRDVSRDTAKEIIATKFHNTVAGVIQKMVLQLSVEHEVSGVILTGGTFQNQYLLHRTIRLLSSDDMTVMTNHQVPPNDACISLGQAYLIRERLKRG